MSGERSIPLHDRPLAIVPAGLHRYAAASALGLLSAAALMVVVRRVAGALTTPLEPAVLLMAGVVVAFTAAAIRVGWLRSAPAPRLDRAIMALTSLAVAALGAGLCVAGTPVISIVVLYAILGVEEGWAWTWYIRHKIDNIKGDSPIFADTKIGKVPIPSPAPTSRKALSLDSEVDVFPEEVTQQLTRSQAADGTEELSGWLRLAFAAAQRTGSLHVAFCPPFAAAPELEVEQIDGPEARIKTAQLLPYGARLDLKLATAADEPTSVLLQFSARWSPLPSGEG